MSRRHYNKLQQEPLPPFAENLVFWAPLTEGDLTDHINGITGTLWNGTFVWNSEKQAYKIKTTSGGQNCLIFSKSNLFNLSPSYNYTTYAELYVESFSGTCDFIKLGTGNIDRSGGVSLGETHRWNNFPTGTWRRLAMTKNGTEVKFYLNGTLNKTSTTSTFESLKAELWSIWGDSVDVIVIGGGFYTYKYTAYIKNVKFFNRALSSQEVAQL